MLARALSDKSKLCVWWEEADFVRPIFFTRGSLGVKDVLVIDDCEIIGDMIKGALKAENISCDICLK